MENFIQQNFIGVWHHFLYFEIKRSNFAVETFGSANAYLIFQVIAWHHILVMMDQAEAKVRKEAVELWFKLTETGFKTRTVLTYSLISSLTSLSIETIRRQVKKLEKKNWVSYSKKEGVKFSPSKENNKFLTEVFNVKEVKDLGYFLDIIEKCKQN
tara:strand:+ start:196 stop:663 length:468 start_codon:yes stop_codon:yes gene_type:complete